MSAVPEREEPAMNEYIKTIRKSVGHAPIIQCGASIIVVNEHGELLLQKRRDNGCWGYHGGSVELDEVVEEAAKRELFEETGLIAETLELLGVFSGEDMHYVYPNGDVVSNIDIVYICRNYTGEIKQELEEISELRFFAPDELPANISPPNVKALNQYVRRFTVSKDSTMEIGEYVFQQAVMADFEQIIRIDNLNRSDKIRRAIEQGDCFVAGSKSHILGFAIMNYSFFDNGFIELLVIAEVHRRRGIGSAMLMYLYRHCKTEKLFISTNESNSPMRRLLAKTGFAPCGKIDALDDGDPELFFVRKKVV
jgi:8-oxo-dGTP pyrophosphatase MutT (NUDIX family)/GNAT superfamily N-acetyltransferase